MLITILGLPLSTKYHEIKVLITQKCGIPDFILDNLLTDTDGTKKVRVGLADDAEGAHVIKCLNGYKLSGNVLRVVPFGKSGIARQNNSAPNHRSTFETQGYQNDFNQMGRSQVDPWGSHSQWTPQQQTGHIQNQNNLSYQQVQQGGGYVSVGTSHTPIRNEFQQGAVNQSGMQNLPNYDYQAGPKQSNRQGVLRTVEIVETPPQNLPGRHQPNYDLQRDRNLALPKGGSDGNQFSLGQQSYQNRQWPQGHEQKMDSYEKSDYGKYMPQDKRILKEQLAMKYKELDKPQYDPHEKKMLKEQLAMKYKHLEKSQYSPQNMHARGLQPRQVSPSPRHSPGRKMTGRMRSPPRRSVSPHGRRLSPPGRRLSPSGRRPSPAAGRTSPMGRSRRMSPGRRVSPAGRNPMEPPVDRRMPSSGMMAHGRPVSPKLRKELGDRNVTRHHSAGHRVDLRYSPPRPTESVAIKQVRPAYEPTPQASNQEMYSGGYRPNDTAQYNLQNVRSEGSSSRWTVRDKHFGKNLDDDRRDVLRMAKFETPRSSDTARVIEDVHGPRSSNRGSRSPRRERSPLRDRYRRHSPSPRSPRRSWALEKRRSPEVPDEAPPPPVWTAESPKQADYRDIRHSYTHAEQTRRQWVPISQSKKEEEARVRQSRHDSRERIRQEAQEMHFRAEEKEQVDFLMIKEDLTRRIEQKAVILKKQEELQKEIEDVYKRAVDFTKKAERHRKGDQRRDDHSAVEKQAQRDIRFDRKDEKRPKPQNNSISFAIKTKRQKATEELADKILSKFGENLPELIKAQVFEQICDAVSKILDDMYGDNDVSFIEAVIKFNSRHNVKDEEKIFDNVMSKFPLQYRVLKRSAEECVPPPPKTPKMATDVAGRRNRFDPRSARPLPQRIRASIPVRKQQHFIGKNPRLVAAQTSEPQKKFTPVEKDGVRKPQHVIAKKPRLVAAKPSEPPKKYTPVEKDEVKNSDAAAIEELFPAEKREGSRELDAVTSKMLEYELRHIMIKVWQEFPDDPPTDEERYVAEKFRNEAGDELTNVIGLNVTKRLLNIYNRLIVKLHFSNRPERSCLLLFLKKYNFRGFKRVPTESNTFAGMLKSVEHFDTICKTKFLKCGSAHVTVTPCYRFMKCPEGLKTKFVDESDAEKDTSLVSENAEKKSEDTTEIIKSADESQKINDGNKKEDELKVAKTIKIEEADNTNKVETAREIAIEANTNISEKMKTEEPSMPQKITSKIIPDVKKEVSKAEEGKKMEVNKSKLTKVNETTIEKSSPQVESVEKTLKDTNAKIVENKPTVKQEFVKNVAKIQTQGKTITKPVNSLQAQTKRVEVKKNLKNVSKADDFEEMADDEILALLSSGVVLDECGSDEE
ncbi:uncharacterized protein LOC126976151 isoform X3 [Leptidea sinapis]|uniref:uncharacterized protein LOC126976151 isoform X3 n=2 Tax=Leptidea sinapis TaxID=189913 RepID=UPI0021C43473|nr:uncharacterized protein LOC126976151 isoform X3 [Leptidea sinapis]